MKEDNSLGFEMSFVMSFSPWSLWKL